MRILLNGALGRMGRCFADCALAQDGVQIAAGVDSAAIAQEQPFPVYADLLDLPLGADVLVDFSSPAGAKQALLWCADAGLPCVICTTGLDAAVARTMDFCAQRIPVFSSANLSLGAALMTELCRMAAAALGPGFEVDILEQHHRAKADAPSGTALALAAAAAAVGHGKICGEADCPLPRPEGTVVLHALRAGTAVGEHEVRFSGRDEILRISHTVASREVFARGALAAARFLICQKPGLYQMKDLIK